jgi:hypothetical protein
MRKTSFRKQVQISSLQVQTKTSKTRELVLENRFKLQGSQVQASKTREKTSCARPRGSPPIFLKLERLLLEDTNLQGNNNAK